MSFEDHFSRAAQDYARHRPSYPTDLFSYLASVSPGLDLAWDCGTGNGQAALALVEHFERVVATDASADQIKHAFRHDAVEYRVEPAESVSLATGSVDLVTVAIAVHWFDFDRFYTEVRRVLKPAGVLAVWTYHLPTIEPRIDSLLRRYHGEVLKGYWPERIRYVDDRYKTLPFPFSELAPPPIHMETAWTLAQVAGFLDSWSGTRRFEAESGRHPLEEIWDQLEAAWGDANQERCLDWPLHLRVGKV